MTQPRLSKFFSTLPAALTGDTDTTFVLPRQTLSRDEAVALLSELQMALGLSDDDEDGVDEPDTNVGPGTGVRVAAVRPLDALANLFKES